MPIYEYLCGNCQFRLEKIQKFSDSPLLDCPACDNPALKKLISAAAFRLKGGGWYETDFKSDKQKNLVDSGNKSKASAAKDSDSGKKGKSTTKEAAA